MFSDKVSDEILEMRISNAEEKLSILYELKERRKQPKVIHRVRDYQARLKQVISVTCACGEVTEFKVPLKTLEDFKCPKDK